MTDLVNHRVEVTRTLPTTPAAQYAAWTEPDLMRRWYATVVDADVRVGGRYSIEIHEDDGTVNGSTGEYLALEPGERVSFTFTHHSRTPEISDEVVTVTFRETAPDRTEVTLVNTWTGPATEPSDHDRLREGWDLWLDMLEKSGVT